MILRIVKKQIKEYPDPDDPNIKSKIETKATIKSNLKKRLARVRVGEEKIVYKGQKSIVFVNTSPDIVKVPLVNRPEVFELETWTFYAFELKDDLPIRLIRIYRTVGDYESGLDEISEILGISDSEMQ